METLAKDMGYNSDTGTNEVQLSKMTTLQKISVPKIPFLRQVRHEPKRNFLDDSMHTATSVATLYSVYELDPSKPTLSGLDHIVVNEVR